MKVAYVNIFVSDLERSINFFENILGLELEHADQEFGYASFDAGPIRLGIAVVAQEQQELVGRHTGIGLVVSDLQAVYDRLIEQEVKFEMPPTKQPWGGFMAMLKDPDENVLYLDQIDPEHG